MDKTVGSAPQIQEPSAEAAWAHVDGVVRASGTSFYWAMRFLPAHKRRAMFAVYAFCREVDDIADEPAPLDEKRRRLSEWRAEIAALVNGEPLAEPTAVALRDVFQPFNFDQADFIAVIDGMEMDAQETMALETWDQLIIYCDRVACAVGRLCCCVFGLDRKTGRELAENLGLALQLTNILRDVSEDAGRDRVYLPSSMLREAGIEATNPQDILGDPHLPLVLDQIAAETGRRFSQASSIIETCDRSQVRPAIMMKEVYARVFRRLLARGWGDLGTRVRLNKFEKLMVALRYGVF